MALTRLHTFLNESVHLDKLFIIEVNHLYKIHFIPAFLVFTQIWQRISQSFVTKRVFNEECVSIVAWALLVQII